MDPNAGQLVFLYGALTTSVALFAWWRHVRGRTPPMLPPPEMARLEAPRAIAHDLRSIAGGVSMAMHVVSKTLAQGRTPKPTLVQELERSTDFLKEVIGALSSPEGVGQFDLWAVVQVSAACHPNVTIARGTTPIMLNARRLDAARLIGLLIDNALEYGGAAEVCPADDGIAVRNPVTRRPDANRPGRGTGLANARALAERLGLRLDVRDEGERFVVALSLLPAAPAPAPAA